MNRKSQFRSDFPFKSAKYSKAVILNWWVRDPFLMGRRPLSGKIKNEQLAVLFFH